MATLNIDHVNNAHRYSDGDSEAELLALFKNGTDLEKEIEQVLSNNPSWPIYYHLSPIRQNLLSWYPFDSHASLLEVGAGCGAITGLFCQKLNRVVAVELTSRRAEILYHRHKMYSNLEIVAGNLNELDISEKFDYVTSIGVLEYAGRFTKTEDPYRDFLKELISYLKPTGKLVLAIENRLGLKYWAGAKEDHTSLLFESIQDYPTVPDVCTFGRVELQDLLASVGLNTQEFYYPHPDYKLPQEVFSDSFCPSSGDSSIDPELLPAKDLSVARDFIFNEHRAYDVISANRSFPLFANSFLVFAGR